MTEIDKMYENANAYKMLCKCEFKNLHDYRIEYGSDVCDYTESKIKEPCKVCEKAKQKIKYYPDFTAEKQLKLIKWLGKRPLTLIIGRYRGKYYFGNSNFTSKADSFDNAIAIRINDLWQSLTDQEKEEIRRILNE